MTRDRPGASPGEVGLRARIAGGSRDVDDYLELADVLQGASRWDEALAIYEQARGLDLQNLAKAKLTTRLGLLHQHRMDRKAAPAFAREALTLVRDEPDSVEVLLIRGCSQSVLAHALWVDDPEAGADEARVAVKWLERVIREDNTSRDATTACYEIARLHNALGNPDQAIIFSQEYLRHDLDQCNRLAGKLVLADALVATDRFREAEATIADAFHDAETFGETPPTLYLLLGLVHQDARRPAEAQRAFEQALKVVQEDKYLRGDKEFVRTLHWHLADLDRNTGNYAHQVSILHELLRLYPEGHAEWHRILIWLGDCHARLGHAAEARRCYQQVIAASTASKAERDAARDGMRDLPSAS